jgi:hypothetical protein
MINQSKLREILDNVEKHTIAPQEAQSLINLLVDNDDPNKGMCECSLPSDAYNGTGRCITCKKIIGIDGRKICDKNQGVGIFSPQPQKPFGF